MLTLLGIGLVVAAYVLLPIKEWLQTFNQFVADLGVWGMVLFVAVYVVAAVLLIPGSALTLGAGVAFGLVNGMIAVSLGSTLGAGAAFLVSRYLARDRVRETFAKGAKFNAVDKAVGEAGWKIVGLLRLSPVFPYNALNYLLGLTSVKFWPYLLASWVGMLPGTLLYVYAGSAVRTTAEEPEGFKTLYNLLGLGITFAVTFSVTRTAKKALKHSTEMEVSP